jgi:hypothetical protein
LVPSSVGPRSLANNQQGARRLVGGRGMGQVYRPATACSSARSDQDAWSPVCAGAGLGGLVHARRAARCRLSHPNIVASSTAAPRPACTIWSWSMWKHNPRRPHQHRGVAGVQPARRQGRQAGHRARQGPRPAGPARSTVSARLWSAPRRGLTASLERAAPARVGAAVASVADAPGGGAGGQAAEPAHRRLPGPSRAVALVA